MEEGTGGVGRGAELGPGLEVGLGLGFVGRLVASSSVSGNSSFCRGAGLSTGSEVGLGPGFVGRAVMSSESPVPGGITVAARAMYKEIVPSFMVYCHACEQKPGTIREIGLNDGFT